MKFCIFYSHMEFQKKFFLLLLAFLINFECKCARDGLKNGTHFFINVSQNLIRQPLTSQGNQVVKIVVLYLHLYKNLHNCLSTKKTKTSEGRGLRIIAAAHSFCRILLRRRDFALPSILDSSLYDFIEGSSGFIVESLTFMHVRSR